MSKNKNTTSGEHVALAVHPRRPRMRWPSIVGLRYPKKLRTHREDGERSGSKVPIVIKGTLIPTVPPARLLRCSSTPFSKSSRPSSSSTRSVTPRIGPRWLDADLRQYREDMDLSSFDYLSFVDTQSPHLPVPVESPPPILTFVDHHKTLGGFDAEHLDIREDVGATSSIRAEYLEHSDYGLEIGNFEHARLATALMHGIRTDTDNFLIGRLLDFRAAPIFVLSLITIRFTISKQSVTARTMEIIQRGLNNKEIRGTFCSQESASCAR